MPVEIISGPFYNALGRGVPYGATPTAGVSLSGGSAARPSFPVAALYDGIVASPMILTVPGSSFSLDISFNLVQCGDGEQATAVGWTAAGVGTGVTTDATDPYKGAKSLKVATSASAGRATQAITVQAGERIGYHWALNNPAGDESSIVVYDPQTARWLNASNEWVNSFAAAFVSDAAAWVEKIGAFSVPGHDVWFSPTGELEIEIYATDDPGGGICYAECLMFPEFDFLGFFGHNLPPETDVTLTSYADWWHGGASTLEATLTAPKRPVAWHSMSAPILAPFIRLTATPASAWGFAVAAWTGELVFGRRQALSSYPEYAVRVEIVHPQERSTTRGGTTWAMATARYPTRQITMAFDTAAAGAAELETIGLMTRGGQTTTIVLPTDTHPNVCILGRPPQSRRADIVNFARTATELVVVEEALPSLE